MLPVGKRWVAHPRSIDTENIVSMPSRYGQTSDTSQWNAEKTVGKATAFSWLNALGYASQFGYPNGRVLQNAARSSFNNYRIFMHSLSEKAGEVKSALIDPAILGEDEEWSRAVGFRAIKRLNMVFLNL